MSRHRRYRSTAYLRGVFPPTCCDAPCQPYNQGFCNPCGTPGENVRWGGEWGIDELGRREQCYLPCGPHAVPPHRPPAEPQPPPPTVPTGYPVPTPGVPVPQPGIPGMPVPPPPSDYPLYTYVPYDPPPPPEYPEPYYTAEMPQCPPGAIWDPTYGCIEPAG